MRTMECLLIVCNFLILGRVLFFKRGLTPTHLILFGFSCVLTFSQILLEGYRWQMIPAYSVLLVLGLHIFVFPHKHAVSASWPVRLLKGTLMGVYLSAVVILPLLVPIFSFCKPTGAYEVGTTTLHFIDSARQDPYSENPKKNRELMVQLWYPAKTGSHEPTAPYTSNPKELALGLEIGFSAPAFALEHLGQVKTHSHQDAHLSDKETSWPLLLFSHGMNQFRNQNTFQFEELASHGYIIAAIDHTYDAAAAVFPDGRVALNRSQLEGGLQELDAHMPLWTGDIKFVLDNLEKLSKDTGDGRFRGAIDMKRVGIFGHSYGGAAAMQMLLQDNRIKAGIDMDGGLYGNPAPAEGIGKPFMMINAQDTDDQLQAASPISDAGLDSSEGLWWELARRTQLALADGGYYLTIPHSDHWSFTDLNLISPLLQNKDADLRYIHRFVNESSLSFFDKYVKGIPSNDLDKVMDRYPEIRLERNSFRQKP